MMNTVVGTILTFLIAATMQNLVLTAGFDSSLMIKLVRHPRGLLRFGVLLLVFTSLTTVLFYPLDELLPESWLFNLLRPLIIVCITGVLYILAIAVLNPFQNLSRRIRHTLPLAAFNNMVVGMALLLNVQVSLSFWLSVGVSAGAAIGFLLLSCITAEATEHMDNPDIPSSFRGLPATLVYLGLLALALMGFSPLLNLT